MIFIYMQKTDNVLLQKYFAILTLRRDAWENQLIKIISEIRPIERNVFNYFKSITIPIDSKIILTNQIWRRQIYILIQLSRISIGWCVYDQL